jgi:hypothetical protein
MAKSGRNSGKTKQDAVISQFSNDIRQLERRNWTTIAEKCMNKTKPETVTQVRISMYNPNNPLNGSSNWSKEKHAEYKSTQKSK